MIAESPSVDIVIAVRNEARLLGQCLESACSQDYEPGRTRIIVVDNDSDDSTRDVAARYPIKLLRESKNGPAAARNRGVEAGTGELVAFLDGHCMTNPSWVSSMVSRFSDSTVGGCQAHLENRAVDPRVAAYIEATGMNDNAVVLEETVRAARTIYPWILSGNCMYRRSVVEYAGGFDESLPACEDVDLSWRAVLRGYLLEYAGGASVVHWNADEWDSFVRKSWQQGRGAAALASRYLPPGAPNIFAPADVSHFQGDRAVIAAKYETGYRYEEARIASGSAASTPFARPAVDRALRMPFRWTDSSSLKVSSDAIYWMNGDSESVIVHQPSRSRFVLDDSADFIWRRLTRGVHRDVLVAEMVRAYAIPAGVAGSDCDELVEQLIESGALMRA